MLSNIKLPFEKIDIIENEELVDAYGDRIPVLAIEHAQQVLFWPFGPQQIEQYLAHYGINPSH